MTLGEHLEELRTRLIRSALALLIAFVGCWIFHEQLGEIALKPLDRAVRWLNADLIELYEQKLEEDPRNPKLLKTVRGAGYMLARGDEA
jgi:Sec-independent protein secretion pathway component TatC